MKRCKVALIGLGRWGSAYADVLAQLHHAELVGISDLDKNNIKILGSKLGTRSYLNYKEMLDKEKPEAVFVCTADWEHLGPCLEIIERDMHLFVEKPLAMNLSDGKEIVEAANSKKIKFSVGHILRFDPRYYKVYELVKNGQLGTILHIFCRRNDLITTPKHYHGKTDPIFQLAIHDIDIIRWLGGKISRVYSEPVNILLKELGTIDGISVLMKLESGATAIIESIWVLPESRGKSTARLEVTCTKGVAFVDDYDRKITVYDSKGVVYPDSIMKPNVWGKVTGVLKEELSLFLDCIINDEPPIVSGEDALESIELALAVKQSSETGEIVTIN